MKEIGFDCDGVILNTPLYKIRCAEKLFPQIKAGGDFERENIVEELQLMDLETYRRFQREIYSSVELTNEFMEFIPGAKAALHNLVQAGYQIQIVTARANEFLIPIQIWLQNKGLDLDIVPVGHGIPKTEAVRGHKLFVDDDPEVLSLLLETGAKLYLFDATYNRDIDLSSQISRVSGWSELLEIIAAMES